MNNDVDKSWDGTGSLDDHRMKCFATLKEAGFGNPTPVDQIKLKPKPVDVPPPVVAPSVVEVVPVPLPAEMPDPIE